MARGKRACDEHFTPVDMSFNTASPVAQEYMQPLMRLVGAMQARHCSVFVGAGLSAHAEYPLWKELVRRLCLRSGKPVARETIETGAEDLLNIAQECRNVLGDEGYRRFLESEFSQWTGKESFLPIHADLLALPFNAYLTTNFDSCIENAAKRVGGVESVQVYPVLDPSHLRHRHVYHLHGRAYDEQGVSTVDTMLLTARDFREAYEERNVLSSLLQDVFRWQTVFFIGHSLDDPFLRRILATSHKDFRELADDASRRGVGTLREKEHFALLPCTYMVQHEAPEQGPVRDEDEEARQVASLRESKVSVIRYNTSPGERCHSELNGLVEWLRDRVSGWTLQGPSMSRVAFEA